MKINIIDYAISHSRVFMGILIFIIFSRAIKTYFNYKIYNEMKYKIRTFTSDLNDGFNGLYLNNWHSGFRDYSLKMNACLELKHVPC